MYSLIALVLVLGPVLDSTAVLIEESSILDYPYFTNDDTILFTSELTLRAYDYYRVGNSQMNFILNASIEVDGQHICSATVIDDYYVLTSKSCVQNINVSQSSVFVRAGTGRIGFRGQELSVTDIYLDDESYLLTTPTDLAMVKVATAFEFDSQVYWANPNNNGLEEGMKGVVLGWEDTSETRSKMMAAPAVVISTNSCTTALQGLYNLSSLQSCIMPTGSTSQTCLADLGAPFYLREQVYGVVSYNPGCDSDLPIVISEVGGSGAFIIEVLVDIFSFF